MLQRVLFGVLLVLVVLIVVDASRTPPAPPVPAAAPTDPAPSEGASVAASRRALPRVLPGTLDPLVGTPTVDMLARLTIRRRLEREGTRVYLDSLLAQTDSVLTRWPSRGDRTYTVYFGADTTLPVWNPAALEDARAGMRAWDGNDAGVVLRETTDSGRADIRVSWVASLSDSSQVGLTQLTWGPDGVVTAATVTLALGQRPEPSGLPSLVRRRVAAHEFGHALGLPHSGRTDDMMYPSSPVSYPSRRDQASLLLLYAVPPGPLRTEP